LKTTKQALKIKAGREDIRVNLLLLSAAPASIQIQLARAAVGKKHTPGLDCAAGLEIFIARSEPPCLGFVNSLLPPPYNQLNNIPWLPFFRGRLLLRFLRPAFSSSVAEQGIDWLID
jgi:hypothetical protein